MHLLQEDRLNLAEDFYKLVKTLTAPQFLNHLIASDFVVR